MRISTNQFYHRNTTNIIERQSSVNQSILNISEGKRVITAGDDAVATNSILNIRQEQALLKQYQTNIDFADSRINVQESAMKSAEDVMFRVKDLIIQGNSIGNDDAARQAIADELKERKQELLSLANSRDESGSYVFGGFKTQNPPFEEQSDSSVVYHGDNGQRETNIGPGVRVATSDSGDKIFMNVGSSSTKIRKALTDGNIQTANKYLDDSFQLNGVITVGKGIGRTIDFPTANVSITEDYKMIPKNGVYIATATIDNKTYNGMMNIGHNPTVNGNTQSIEIHLFNFNKDIYHKAISVKILKRLRDEYKFESVNALKNQLNDDKNKALTYFENND